jgi:hypothetical protein
VGYALREPRNGTLVSKMVSKFYSSSGTGMDMVGDALRVYDCLHALHSQADRECKVRKARVMY